MLDSIALDFALVAKALASKGGFTYSIELNVAHEAAQLYHITLPGANRYNCLSVQLHTVIIFCLFPVAYVVK